MPATPALTAEQERLYRELRHRNHVAVCLAREARRRGETAPPKIGKNSQRRQQKAFTALYGTPKSLGRFPWPEEAKADLQILWAYFSIREIAERLTEKYIDDYGVEVTLRAVINKAQKLGLTRRAIEN